MKKLIVFFIICTIGTSLLAQNPTYQQKLYYSCKVWGFVKYYHSKVSVCDVNWDSVLVSTLPLIKNAVTNNDFNDALDTMLLAAGPMDIAITPSPDTLPPELKRNLNFGWINDPIFRADVKVILDTIKNNFRPHTICWVKENDFLTNYQGLLVFPYDSLMLNINTTTNYPNDYNRLLILFKYWNIINYFNPYNYVLDTPWDSTLFNKVISIANAPDDTVFFNSFKIIIADLNDAHAEGLTYNDYLPFPDYYSPKLVLEYVQNNYVVVKSAFSFIHNGDIIVSIDSMTTTQWEDSLRPYISAGNPAVFHRYMCYYMLSGSHNSVIHIVYRDSLNNNHNLSTWRGSSFYTSWFTSYYPNDTLATIKWKKWDCNVGYVNMGNLQTADVSPMYNNLRSTNAIIFDLRNYPNATIWDIADLIFPNSTSCVKFTYPDVTYPGTYFWDPVSIGNNGNPTPYTGQVIILMNQETQSQAEYSCMILDAMPNVVKVGSQTAGADGGITYFRLSQDIYSGFTSLGVYYPNGDSTQRIGIVPDSIVYPTIAGIRHGRDEVFEKALEIANCVNSIPNYGSETHVEINIFPNPTANILTIETSEKATLEILNIEGQIIKTINTADKQITIDLRNLSSGVYIIKAKTERGVAVKKFIKE